MADAFGDPNLFAEFDRTPDRTDKILMKKFDADLRNKNGEDADANSDTEMRDLRSPVAFSLESDSEGEIWDFHDDIETETNAAENVNGEAGTKSVEIAASEIVKLQSELQRIRKECERWKRHSRIISTSKYGKLDEGPAVQVVYMNNAVASKHRSTIESFLSGLILQEMYQGDADYQPQEKLRRAAVILDQAEGIPTPDEKMRQISTSMVIGCSQLYKDFIIDNMGWSLTMNNPSISDGWDRPSYEQTFHVALPDSDDDEDSCPQQKHSRPKATCFNCDGNHSIKDCKEKYNAVKVNANKQKFRSQQGPKAGRYLDDPKFSKYKAGKISETLREAMGLSDEQMPRYIYNMRQLGYPPGHLQAHNENSSGLTMFDKHGKEMSVDGESAEDGEVEAAPDTDFLDVTKLIDYPGFNVPKDDNIKEESQRFGRPEFSSRQSKERMAQHLGSKNRGVKRAGSDSALPDRKRKSGSYQPNQSVDMDMSDEASPRKRTTRDNSNDSGGSPDDLEAQRDLIQQQLALAEGGDADVQVLDSTSGSRDSDSFVPPLPPTPVRPPLPDSTPPVTPTMGTPKRSRSATTPAADSSVFKTPDNPRLLRTPSSGGSLAMSLGTPISERVTPTMKKGLPGADKFFDGIQQDIPFENLPGSTGTFERMQKLLKHMRSRQKDS